MLAVSSEGGGTVYYFRVGSGQRGGQGSVKATGGSSASLSQTGGKGLGYSDTRLESVDWTTKELDGGYGVCVDKERKCSVRSLIIYCPYSLTNSSWRSLALCCKESPYKLLTYPMGGYRRSRNLKRCLTMSSFTEALLNYIDSSYRKFVDGFDIFDSPFYGIPTMHLGLERTLSTARRMQQLGANKMPYFQAVFGTRT